MSRTVQQYRPRPRSDARTTRMRSHSFEEAAMSSACKGGLRARTPWSLCRKALLGLAIATLPIASGNAEPTPVLAYVAAKNANPKRLDILKKGLAELGLAEARTIRIEYREAVLDTEYDAVMAELVGRKVDIILAANVAATRAAARATKTIPIVILGVFDPVGSGVVKSLEKPGTNVTGTTMYAPQLVGERLRILKRLVPPLDKA